MFSQIQGHCNENELKLILITGCGRSGTEFIATFLKKSGLDINHEQVGNDGCVSWPMLANNYSPWGPISQDKYIHIFHQVRHPLSVITSWFINLNSLQRDEWLFIRRYIPEINQQDSLMVQCCKYWYYWNLKAEKIAEWRYRIEDLNSSMPEFQYRLGISLNTNLLKDLPKNINSWKQTNNKLEWKDLKNEIPSTLYNDIKEMAHRYGYLVE